MAGKMIKDAEKAFATTTLTFFMHQLHFDEDFAKQIAEFIKALDEQYTDDELTWRLIFGMKIVPLVNDIASAINKGHEREELNE